MFMLLNFKQFEQLQDAPIKILNPHFSESL